MIVISGSASQLLARTLADELDVEYGKVKFKRFPDGEAYIRILTDLNNENVLLVQNAHPDENIIELFLLQDAVREFDVKRLTTIVPYFGYARQDKKFEDGECISARTMAKHIQLCADEFFTVDLHTLMILEWFDIPAVNISAMKAIAEKLVDFDIDIVFSPDKGGIERAKHVADAIGCECDFFEKKRRDAHHVEMSAKHIDVKQKNVAIVDDIISTGNTIAKAAEQLRANKAESVIAACTHGLFIGDALKKLKKCCNSVFSTDTIENETTEISVALEIAKAIK